MTREELAIDIIRIIEKKTHSYVFGGYVRDLIAHVPFNDIDIYLPKGVSFRSIRDLFLINSYYSELIDSCGLESYGIKNVVRKQYSLTPHNSSVCIQIDCVKSCDGFDDNPFRKGMDADINFLKLQNDVISLAPCLCETTTFDQVVDNICAKQFVAGSQMSQYRIQKLLTKGYTQIGVDSQTIDHNVHKSIITCDKCNGTGVLDFEFYTRTCECKLR